MIASQQTFAKGFLFLSMAFAFSLPLSRAGINLFGFGLFLLWIVEGGFKEKFQTLIKEKFTLTILLFLLYQAVVLLWVEPQHRAMAVDYSFKYIYFLIPLILYTSLDPKQLKALLYAFLAGMLVTSLESLALYFDLYHHTTKIAHSLSLHMWHTYYSVYLAFSAILVLLLMWYKKAFLLFGGLFLLISAALFLGVARTGELFFVVFIFYFLLKLPIKHKKTILASVSAIFLVAILALYQFNSIFHDRANMAVQDIQQIKHENLCNSLGMRLFTWRVAGEILESDPLLGLGTIDHLEYLQNALSKDKQASVCEIKDQISNFHAQYIETFAQSGLVGVVLLLALFYTLARLPIQDPLYQNIRILFIAILLYDFFLEYPFRVTSMLALFALFSSILLLQKRSEDAL